jgi:hypothetical protein
MLPVSLPISLTGCGHERRIESGGNNYLISITTRQGRLFAVFVNTPSSRVCEPEPFTLTQPGGYHMTVEELPT